LLAQRIASAAIGVPIIVLLIYVGGVWYVAVVAAALAVAAAEYQHARRPWLDPVCVLAALIAGGIAVGAHGDRIVWLAWLGAALVVMPVAALLSPVEGDDAVIDVFWTLGGVTYVGFLGGFIVLLRDLDPDGRSWVYLAVLSTFAVDTGSYFVGRAIGRRPLAPTISPKKTVEGFLGGYACGFAAVLALNTAFDLGVDVPRIVLLGVLLPPLAAAGDLGESAVKRALGIKDASGLIPGHGGVLDRLDSILFTVTLVYLFTQWAL
jgi:phosphatidate cytidylyltransferase